jgi:HSP20 family protein
VNGTWGITMNVDRDACGIRIRARVPGIDPEDLEITVEDELLTLSCEHEERTETADQGYLRRERHVGSFRHSMSLPAEVDPEATRATALDDEVEITVPFGPRSSSHCHIRVRPTSY